VFVRLTGRRPGVSTRFSSRSRRLSLISHPDEITQLILEAAGQH